MSLTDGIPVVPSAARSLDPFGFGGAARETDSSRVRLRPLCKKAPLPFTHPLTLGESERRTDGRTADLGVVSDTQL